MQGFVQLDPEDGRGGAWVRLAHITAISTIHAREGSGEEHHLVSVLAGGQWFRDPVDHPSAAAAQRRVDELAGLAPALPWAKRLRAAVRVVRGGDGG